jgi:hypothetical protein
MKLFRAILTALSAWRAARLERKRMQRVEQELDIKRELDYRENRLGEEGTYRILTSAGITQAVSNEYFRRIGN